MLLPERRKMVILGHPQRLERSLLVCLAEGRSHGTAGRAVGDGRCRRAADGAGARTAGYGRSWNGRSCNLPWGRSKSVPLQAEQTAWRMGIGVVASAVTVLRAFPYLCRRWDCRPGPEGARRVPRLSLYLSWCCWFCGECMPSLLLLQCCSSSLSQSSARVAFLAGNAA